MYHDSKGPQKENDFAENAKVVLIAVLSTYLADHIDSMINFLVNCISHLI